MQPPDPAAVSLEQIVERVENDRISLAFVGERHGIGPVKRFAVDLANELVNRGHDVGLYVEGFRMGCVPHDPDCNRLATCFNWDAYLTLLEQSKAAVHPIDPSDGNDRAARMAAAIAAGNESIRIVLIGQSHMIFATDPNAEYRVFGGQLPYSDPGDVAEAFPREAYLTIGLETALRVNGPYALLTSDGVCSDYVLVTESTGTY